MPDAATSDVPAWLPGEAAIPGLACPRCHASPIGPAVAEELECPGCGTVYPVIGRVPVMFGTVLPPAAEARVTAAAVRDVLTAFQLPTDALTVLRLRRLMQRQPRFGDALVQTEAAQFVERVRGSGWAVEANGEASQAMDRAAPRPGRQGPAELRPRIRWIADHVPRIIPPGHEFTVNLRFRNTGAVTLRHRPPGNVTIAPRWLWPDGREIPGAADLRTPLPLDVPPGRELTLPVTLAAPSGQGRCHLRLVMVEEGVGWLDEDATEIAVTLRPTQWAETPAGWRIEPVRDLDYGADHALGLEVLRAWLADAGPRPRVLEVGGNAYPAIAEVGGERHNMDVDLLGLQVGCMVQDRMVPERTAAGHDPSRVHMVCADADALPYPAGHFDAVAMFATLHHFPDPARTLAGLAGHLRRGGFIAVLCEPVGHFHPGHPDPGFLRELERGVNEQSFLLREWAEIFRTARLDVAEARVDGSSLKARLVPAETVGA